MASPLRSSGTDEHRTSWCGTTGLDARPAEDGPARRVDFAGACRAGSGPACRPLPRVTSVPHSCGLARGYLPMRTLVANSSSPYIPPVGRPTTGAIRTGLGAAQEIFPDPMAAWTSAALV